jgi:hypothetical protein
MMETEVKSIMTEPGDKLQAALNHDFATTDKDLPAEYLAACRRWYDAMADRDKAMAITARATFDNGDETGALKIAAALPPAPKLSHS